jgi:hypothetical protein
MTGIQELKIPCNAQGVIPHTGKYRLKKGKPHVENLKILKNLQYNAVL